MVVGMDIVRKLEILADAAKYDVVIISSDDKRLRVRLRLLFKPCIKRY